MSYHRSFALSDLAKQDIKDIVKYTRRTWGQRQVEKYKEKLLQGFDLITEQPFIGKEIKNGLSPLRLWRIEKHNILYEVKDDHILIIRILHVNRDLSRLES